MKKQSALNMIVVDSSGRVFFQIMKQVVDGDKVLMNEPHRSVLEPTTKASTQFKLVNDSLNEMGFPPMTKEDTDRILAHAKTAHTPTVVKKFKAARDAELKAARQNVKE